MTRTADYGAPLRRRLFRHRLREVLAGRGTALAWGAVLIVTALAYVHGARGVLAQNFGPEFCADPDVSRLARQAIEQRLQLAEAQALVHSGLARAVDGILTSFDQRLYAIAAKVRAAVAGRGAARFQAGMSQLARKRLTEVTRIADGAGSETAETARKVAHGLTAQLEALGGLVAHAEHRLMALDHAVAEFGTVVAQVLLSLSRCD